MMCSLKDIPQEKWGQIYGGEVCMWGETGRSGGDASRSRCQRFRKHHHAAIDRCGGANVDTA